MVSDPFPEVILRQYVFSFSDVRGFQGKQLVFLESLGTAQDDLKAWNIKLKTCL